METKAIYQTRGSFEFIQRLTYRLKLAPAREILTLLLLFVLNVSTPAQFLYTNINNEITITKYIGKHGAVVIPSTIDGLPVRALGASCFSNAPITKITIPEGVTSIGDNAFALCYELISLTVPNSTTNIGAQAFTDCQRLMTLSLGENVAHIGERAFAFCYALHRISVNPANSFYSDLDGILFHKSKTELIRFPSRKVYFQGSLPATLTSIGEGAFESLAFTRFEIPSGVLNIASNAFIYCYALTNVVIPASVQQIGEDPFHYCNALASISVTPQNQFFSDVNGILYNKAQTVLLKYPARIAGADFTVPSTVSRISASAFFYSTLKSISLPASLTSIGSAAFLECDIGQIEIPAGVTAIKERTFFLCSSLTNVLLPPNLISIEASAFGNCSKLASIDLPTQLSSLGEEAFSSCSKLRSVILPAAVRSIPKGAFENCAALTNLAFPGVTNIGPRAVAGCHELTNITIPAQVLAIQESAFSGCDRVRNINLPEGLRLLGDHSFELTGLTNITIPASVVHIGAGAFASSYLSQINVSPNNQFYSDLDGVLSSKDQSVLIHHPRVKNDPMFHIPETVREISQGFFDNFYELREITTAPSNPYFSSLNGVLYNKDRTKLLRYPLHKTDAAFTIPQTVTNIGYGALGGCFYLSEVTMPDSVTILEPFAFANSELTHLSLSSNLTTIADAAFLQNQKLTTLELPPSVKNLGSAFALCYALTEINIPEGITNIGDGMFQYCSNLTRLKIPSSATSIGARAFTSCASLTNIDLGNSITFISESAFENCGNLAAINLPATLQTIGFYAFWRCSKLENIHIPNSVTSIGVHAFSECSGLTNVALSTNLTALVDSLFMDCPSLSSINVPEGISTIAQGAFYRCTALTNVTLPNSLQDLGLIAFGGCTSLSTLRLPDTLEFMDAAVQSSGLVHFDIPPKIKEIPQAMFAECSNLGSVTVPKGVHAVDSWAFADAPSLRRVYFRGDAPTVASNAFEHSDQAVVYYFAGATGWSSTFASRPTVLINPRFTGPAIDTNDFTFTIEVAPNIPVILESSISLDAASWVAISTNTLPASGVLVYHRQKSAAREFFRFQLQ